MPGFFSLVRRRYQLVASSKRAERQLEKAQAVVQHARRTATQARDQLEQTRGVAALPHADQPSAEDTQLIAALDAYDHIRRVVEVPLAEAQRAWRVDVDIRRQLRSLKHLARAFLVQSVRVAFAQELHIAETSLKATSLILRTRLTEEILRAASVFSVTPEQSLHKYQQNNATFIASLERLQVHLGTDEARGSHGGLSAGIALEVESARLNNGPLTDSLRTYQSFGARYLVLQEHSLLGDEMGLGKTVQPSISGVINTLLAAPSEIILADEVVTALAPVYLRRTQADVLTELPERVEIEEWVDLSEEDLEVYMNAPLDVMSKRVAVNVGNGTRSSAKYERLLDILDDHADAHRKVVVFSYFRQTIEDVCALTGGAPSITGDTTGQQRQRIIDEFSTDPSARVLVAQIEAAGLGVNLQAAQVVVLREAQFKPSSENQSIARVHRMGQSRTAMVHRLLARNTIEERLVQIIAEKTQIFNDYAHDSSVRDASSMATDSRDGLTQSDMKKLLEG